MGQDRLSERFEAYSTWRAALARRIAAYRDWLDDNELNDAQTALRIATLLARLNQDKLSVAFVAETTYIAQRRGGARSLRLVVRRTRLTNPRQQALWPNWRHHCFVTNVDLDTVAVELPRRRGQHLVDLHRGRLASVEGVHQGRLEPLDIDAAPKAWPPASRKADRQQ